jgi:hypothetical protein
MVFVGDQAESEENPDKILAGEAWAKFGRAFRALVAAAGIGLVFTTRATLGYDPTHPGGLDFEWYGNHCGPGHGDPDDPAIDDLDEACKRHDAALSEKE